MKHIKQLLDLLKDANGKYSVNKVIVAITLVAVAVAVAANLLHFPVCRCNRDFGLGILS